MDLAEFLAARLDEDEAAAKAWLPRVRLDGSSTWYDELDESNLGPYSIEHARLHDPARVLREVEAGRRLIYAYDAAQTMLNKYEAGEKGGDLTAAERQERLGWYGGAVNALTEAVRLRISVYRDHPDYDPAWAIHG